MKLLHRTSFYYVFFSAITYILVAWAFYLVVEYVIYQQVEKRLKVERRDFENFTQQNAWEDNGYFVENKIEVKAVKDTLGKFTVFSDTLLYNRYNAEFVPFREYRFYAMMHDTPYRVTIRKSLIESKELLKFITGTMLILLSIGMGLLFLLQKRIAEKLWQPFYQTLFRAKSFDLREGHGLSLPEENIFEFNELNRVLDKMTGKISGDYKNLKEFTEDAAHEIQTPLALINNRVEELIQEKNFSEQQMYWIQDIHQSTLRLSKLHTALLLLSKIENGQFQAGSKVNITELVAKKLAEFDEIFLQRNLTVKIEKTGVLWMEINHILADVLLTNLVNNAVKHNIPDGKINVSITPEELKISNTGLSLTSNPEELFERFKKQNHESGSLGLGLAIAKKICDSYRLKISYSFDGHLHTLRVNLT